ncbi:hypothetical protein [Sanyastnella coralliicola]|uniref:hypothetical protein n=1 Tax=Sanyastnella coralliicola TaxID=3069118 RepID=UPI0027BAA0BD|nr:hypothetical protein [Longitalea sp. SCSIO 12813]
MTLFVRGQEKYETPLFDCGFHVGSNYSLLRSSDDFSGDWMHGLGELDLGVFLKFRVKAPLMMRVEVLSTRRSFTGPRPYVNRTAAGTSAVALIRAKTLEFYTLYNVIGEFHATSKASAYTGVSLGIRRDVDVIIDVEDYLRWREETELGSMGSTPNSRRKQDFGLLVGTQYRLNQWLDVGLRFTQMLSPGYSRNDVVDIRLSSLQLYVTIGLPQ